MNIILLSGGSGKRLWPLSNDIRSKQFIKIFKKATPKHYEELEDIKAVKDYEDTGNTEAAKELYESMVQRIYRQIKKADPDSIITIATSKSQVSSLHNQLGFDIDISVEPTRRDTFAAIALAVAYLHDVKGISSSEAVVVCPVDPYVDETYFDCLKKLYEKAQEGNRKLILMGIEATYPSEKYGYIKPTCPSIEHIEPTEYTEQNFRQQQSGQQQDKILGTTLRTWSFTEKPTKEKAEEYIESGALWNGGVFAFKLNYILEKSRELLGTDDYETLRGNYSKLKKISFDYAVVEQETSIDVVKYSGMWKDLGTWNTLTEAMEENSIGDAIITDTCENVHVVNELDVPVVATGLKNVIVSASPEGILVSDKEQSSFIKPIVDSFDQQVMFADKSWGTYRVLDVGESSLTIKVVLKAKEHMNYHSHSHRDEVWTVVTGHGRTIVDGMEQPVKVGDVITMAAGCKHTVIAGEDGLQLIEVQLGNGISVSDKKKYAFPEP